MRLHRYATTNGWGYSASNDERSGSELIGGPRRPGEENGNRRSNQHWSTRGVGSAGIVHDLYRRPVEALRYGIGAAGSGAARGEPAYPAQRVCRDHRAIGIRNIYLHDSDRLPGLAQLVPL